MNKRFLSILCFLFCLVPGLWAQDEALLKKQLAGAKADTTRLRLLVELSDICPPEEILTYSDAAIALSNKLLAVTSDKKIKEQLLKYKVMGLTNSAFAYDDLGQVKKAIAYDLQGIKILGEIKEEQGLGSLYSNLGGIYNDAGQTDSALLLYKKAELYHRKFNDNDGLATVLNNFANVYISLGDVEKALDYDVQALKLREKIGNPGEIANSYNNIGFIYVQQGETEKAMEYFIKATALYTKTKDASGLAFSYDHIAGIYVSKQNWSAAMQYFQKAFELRKKANDMEGIAISYNNMGLVYHYTNDLDKAIDNYLLSIAIHKQINNWVGYGASQYNVASIYFLKKDFVRAKTYTDSAFKIAKETGYPDNIYKCAALLSRLDSAQGNYQASFEHYETYIRFRDSVFNEKTRKATVKAQLKYEYETKAAADSVRTAEERKVTAARFESERTQRYVLLGGLLMVAIFAVFMVRRFRITSRQKKLIEEQKVLVETQKHIVEEKQKEILDSIYYARRIQRALITNEVYIQRHLNRLMKRTLCLLILLSVNALVAQQDPLDSLLQVRKNYKSDCNLSCLKDSVLVRIIENISWKMKSINADSGLIFAKEESALAHRINWQKGIALSETQMAVCLKYTGKYAEALQHLMQAIVEWNKLAAQQPAQKAAAQLGIIKVYMQTGAIYSLQGDNKNGIKEYNKGLELALILGDKKMLAGIYGNMGISYSALGDYKKSIEYNMQSLKLAEELGEKRSVGIDLFSMGNVYYTQGDYTKALEYFARAVQIAQELKDDYFYIDARQRQSLTYFHMGKFGQAREITLKCIEQCRKIDYQYTLASLLTDMSDIALAEKKYQEAFDYATQSVQVARIVNTGILESGALTICGVSSKMLGKTKEAEKYLLDALRIAYKDAVWDAITINEKELYQLYKETGKYKEAREHYRQFVAYRDSISNDEADKAIVKMDLKYEYEKKAAADSVRVQEEKKIAEAQLAKEQTQRYALYGGLGLVGLFAVFMVNRLIVTNRQKKLIEEQKKVVEEQKHVVEEKQKEILDSIYYARRIQRALITNEKYIDRNLRKLRQS